MLLAAQRPALMNGYRHPAGLTAAGAVVTLAMTGLGLYTLATQVPPLFR
jgi:Mn2+/Fe2+ NRAMP family transporter